MVCPCFPRSKLNVHPGELDLDRFNKLADEGEQALRVGHVPAAADRLGQALRLWRAGDGGRR